MDRLLSALWSALPRRQLAVIAGLTLLALVGLSFGRIVIANYQLQLQKQQLYAHVEALKAENHSLQTQVTALQTDAAVEALAREELGWVKPGDTAVIVVRPTAMPTRTTRGTSP